MSRHIIVKIGYIGTAYEGFQKQNRANFMTQEEFAQTEAGKMTDKQWIKYREQVVRNSMQSSLR